MPKPDRRSEVAYIYVLYDPRKRVPRYVGRTNNPERRLHLHVVCAQRWATGNTRPEDNPRLYAWINVLLREGRKPSVFVLQRTSYRVAIKQEKRWYRYFWHLGHNLLNSRRQPFHKSALAA